MSGNDILKMCKKLCLNDSGTALAKFYKFQIQCINKCYVHR